MALHDFWEGGMAAVAERCEEHGKVLFGTEGEAVARLLDILARNPQALVKRAYFDKGCGNWHLTKLAVGRPGG